MDPTHSSSLVYRAVIFIQVFLVLCVVLFDLVSSETQKKFLLGIVNVVEVTGLSCKKQTLTEMQGKSAYNRSLWYGSFVDPAHSRCLVNRVILFIRVFLLSRVGWLIWFQVKY